jgi:V/A-type H+/Na+-transporting ATPase subunit F
MPKMAVVGDSTSIMGFKPLGLDTYALNDADRISALWPQLLQDDYAIVLMTEPVFEKAQALLKQAETRVTPAVIAIPSTAGATGGGRRYIQGLMERAIGASIKTKPPAETVKRT